MSVSEARRRVLAVCLYVSEGRKSYALQRIRSAATSRGPAVQLVDFFNDSAYDRTGITLASSASSATLRDAALAVFSEALTHARGEGGTGQHPKVGIVDHVSCHHLASSLPSDSSALASSIASGVASLGVSVHLYGFSTSESLASIRRSLGYFGDHSGGNAALSSRPPDFPHDQAVRRQLIASRGGIDDIGVCTIGNAPWVVGLNAMTDTIDAARDGAAAVSERKGGIRGVQAVALDREDGTAEVACNIPADADASPEEVSDTIKCKVNNDGKGCYLRSYRTNATPEKIVNFAAKADMLSISARQTEEADSVNAEQYHRKSA